MGYYETYDYAYDYPSSMNSDITTVLMIYLLFFLVWGIFALASYIVKGIGLYTIAKRQGADYPWLAFVPFARTYLHGNLGGKILLKKKVIQSPGVWLLVLPFIQGAVIMVFYLVLLGVVGFSAFSAMSSYGSDYYTPSVGTIGSLIVLMVLFVVILVAFGAVYQVLHILVNHQILEKFTSKNMSIVHAVLMGIVPLYEAICFLIMSRKPYNPGMEPPEERPFIQIPPVSPVSPESSANPMPSESPVNQDTAFVPQRGLLNSAQEQDAGSEMPATEPEEKQDEKNYKTDVEETEDE